MGFLGGGGGGRTGQQEVSCYLFFHLINVALFLFGYVFMLVFLFNLKTGNCAPNAESRHYG